MLCSTISIFGNKIFSEILSEMKLFSKYKVKYYDDIDLCIKNAENNNEFVVFFVSKVNKNFFSEIKKKNFSINFNWWRCTVKKYSIRWNWK